jgi:hypothetical protein
MRHVVSSQHGKARADECVEDHSGSDADVKCWNVRPIFLRVE